MFILFKHRGESMSRLRVMSVFLIFIITQLRVFVNKIVNLLIIHSRVLLLN